MWVGVSCLASSRNTNRIRFNLKERIIRSRLVSVSIEFVGVVDLEVILWSINWVSILKVPLFIDIHYNRVKIYLSWFFVVRISLSNCLWLPQLRIISIVNVIHGVISLSSSVRLSLIRRSYKRIHWILVLCHGHDFWVGWFPKLGIVCVIDIVHCTVGVSTSIRLSFVGRANERIWVVMLSIDLQHNRIRKISLWIWNDRPSSNFLELFQVPLWAIIIVVEARDLALFRLVNEVWSFRFSY